MDNGLILLDITDIVTDIISMTQKKWSKVLQYYAEFSLCGGKVGWGHVTNPMNLPHSAAKIPKVLQHFFNLGKVWKHGRSWTTTSIVFEPYQRF